MVAFNANGWSREGEGEEGELEEKGEHGLGEHLRGVDLGESLRFVGDLAWCC